MISFDEWEATILEDEAEYCIDRSQIWAMIAWDFNGAQLQAKIELLQDEKAELRAMVDAACKLPGISKSVMRRVVLQGGQ